MRNEEFYNLFVNQLEEMYNAENQILKALPKMIKLAQSKDLKEALSDHLAETEHQVTRIEEIFTLLSITARDKISKGMEALLQEGEEIVQNKTKSPALDAAIICACQKVEHYEIASYGTLRSFAEHLDLADEVANNFQDTLDEEGALDHVLTKIADGSVFTSGINEVAAKIKE